MPQNNVVFIDSTRQSAPVLAGQANTLNALLYQVLCTGFNSGATTITRSSAVATASRSGHGFKTHDWVLIAGADQSEYNGMKLVTGYDANTFTFAVSGTPASPATGSITSAFAPLGWTRDYNSGNKSVFHGDDQSSLLPIYIDDSGAIGSQSYRGAWFNGFESWADGVGTNPWPTVTQAATGLYWNKSSTADGTARPWFVRGDAKRFYMGTRWLAGDSRFEVVGFGNYGNEIPGNAFNGFIIGGTADGQTAVGGSNQFATVTNLGGAVATNYGKFFCRKYDGTGSAITFGMSGNNQGASIILGNGGMTGANPATSGYEIVPIDIHAGTPIASASFYSKLPGAYNMLHDRLFTNYDILPEFPELPGRRLMVFVLGSGGSVEGRLVLDITGPD